MPSTSTMLRIPLAAALRHPGNARQVASTVELDGLSGVAAEISAGTPVAIDVQLERVPEGIVVRGTLSTAWVSACSRCLEPVGGEISVHVDELFELVPLDGETYQLDEDVIDLEPMVRDALLLELPLAPLCDPDCAGLCATCGVNRNLTACECVTTEIDPRWAALRSLEL
ncbi:MAG: YceD family protein [Acidimicrobiia bacterium]